MRLDTRIRGAGRRVTGRRAPRRPPAFTRNNARRTEAEPTLSFPFLMEHGQKIINEQPSTANVTASTDITVVFAYTSFSFQALHKEVPEVRKTFCEL